MEFSQVFVQLMVNISHSSLALLLRLKINSRFFHDFVEMAIYYNLVIFNGLNYFLIASVHTFKTVTNSS